MSFLAFLDHAWNLPFLVLLGLVAVYFALQLVGLAAHDGDAEVDADGDADVDAAHDVDGDSAHDGEAGAHEHDGAWHEVLAFFGVGRVPFMVVWVTFFIFAGFTGLTVNRIAAARGDYRGWMFAVAVASAGVVGAVAVRLFSRLAARLVDVGGRGAARKHELCGKLAIVASARVDDAGGELRVRDDHGNELLVHGRIVAGEAPLPHGAPVVLVDFDETRALFSVTSLP